MPLRSTSRGSRLLFVGTIYIWRFRLNIRNTQWTMYSGKHQVNVTVTWKVANLEQQVVGENELGVVCPLMSWHCLQYSLNIVLLGLVYIRRHRASTYSVATFSSLFYSPNAYPKAFTLHSWESSRSSAMRPMPYFFRDHFKRWQPTIFWSCIFPMRLLAFRSIYVECHNNLYGRDSLTMRICDEQNIY